MGQEIFNNNDNFNSVKVLSSFKSNNEKAVKENWQIALRQNPKIFNGNQLAIEIDRDSEYKYTVLPVKYAQALASNKKIISKHFAVAGVAAIIITKDKQIIIGSRDAGRDKTDPNKYPLQVPNGGLDSNKSQLEFLNLLNLLYERTKSDQNKLNKFTTSQQQYASLDYKSKFGEDESKTDFNNFISTEGIREVTEELLNFNDNDIKELGVIGGLTTVIEGKTYLKAGVPVYEVKYTLEELKHMRKENPPIDNWEMTVIEGLSLEKLVEFMSNEYKMQFDGQLRKHLQPYVFENLYGHINQNYCSNILSKNKALTPIQIEQKKLNDNFCKEEKLKKSTNKYSLVIE